MAERAPRRIRRPGHLALGVRDLAESVEFYTSVVGLTRVEEVDGAVYLRSQFEHHCLELRAAEAPGVAHLAWETDSDAETEALQDALRRLGVPLREAPPEPGRAGAAFQFRDAGGMWNEVYRSMERQPVTVAPGPMPVMRLGHFTRMSADVDAEVAFFRAAGFRVSDWVPGVQGFLRCNQEHHNLGLLGFERAMLHHHAFDVGDWGGIKMVLDWLCRQGWPVEVGPVRHAAGNNVALYIRDPNAVRVEFFCELEQIPDDEDHVERRQPIVFDRWQQKPPPPGFRD